MRVLWLDAFHGGSHKAVAQGYANNSRHEVTLLSLSTAGGWRWRMRGAAVTFARQLREQIQQPFDLLIATDMLDLATFLGLSRDLTAHIPAALYMHENQLTYPLPPERQRDLSFPWMNYTAALAADAIFFNSSFHRQVWLEALPGLVGRFHDHQERDLIETIAQRSHVLYPGIDLQRFDREQGDDPHPQPLSRTKEGGVPAQHDAAFTRERGSKGASDSPIILWNSRWDYDKGPQAFFSALQQLQQRGVDFRVIIAGEHVDPDDAIFAAAREWLAPHILSWGYAPDFARYRDLLYQADIVVSAAQQEFFGIAVLEAMYCGCFPVLPRRLSYPELLPAALHEVCLYDTDAELANRLEATIRNIEALRQHDLRSIAAAYDWKQMAAQYDKAFEALL